MNYSDRFNYFFLNQYIFVSAVLLMVAGVGVSESVHAVDPSQLWLPRNYNRYPKELKQAADVAETTKRCRQVIAGTASTKHSQKDHPVFKIICRDENKKTFPWLIDGKTMEIVNKPKGQEVVPLKEAVVEEAKGETNVEGTSEAAVKEAVAEKEELGPSEHDKVWATCSYHLRERVKHLRGLSLDTDVMPLPIELESKGLFFELSFKAEGKELEEGLREELFYKAKCQYEDEEYALEVYPAEDMLRVNPVVEKRKPTVSREANRKNSGNDQIGLGGSPVEKHTVSQLSEKTAGTISEVVSNPVKIKMGDNLVDACLDQLKKKTAALDQVVWLTEKTETRSQSSKSKKRSQALEIDFDAVGPSGRKLHSTGLCYFDSDKISVTIQNRHAE